MTTPITEPTITLEQVNYVLQQAALQVQVAMMLSFSLFLVFFMVLAFAFHWRKTGLFFAIAWGVLTAFIPNGWSMVIGPVVAVMGVIALGMEFLRPKK